MSVPHPLPYQGSKRKIADAIICRIPDGTVRLIEPFAGSAAVSLAAAAANRACHFLLNDINHPLMALWGEIVYRPSEIAQRYRELWHAQQDREIDYYFDIRHQFNKTQSPDLFLFLLVRCVKAAVRYNSNGEFNQSPDKRRKGTHPDTMEKNILAASQLLCDRITLTCGDYRSILENASIDDVIYMDPPYQGVSGDKNRRYLESLTFDSFVETLEQLNSRNIAYLVSYDGRTGTKSHGRLLPEVLRLGHIEIEAGRSTQETLLGRASITYESLYLSPALLERLQAIPAL